MAWTIRLSDESRKQLKKLDRQTADRITRYMDEHVAALGNPRSLGKALEDDLSGYWRYRVGAYRVICELQDGELVVVVIKVGHRKEVYH